MSDEGLRSRLRSALLEMHTNMNDVDDVIQGFEKKLEGIVNKLNQLEERVKRLEDLINSGGSM